MELSEAQKQINQLVNDTYQAKLEADKAEKKYSELRQKLTELMSSTETPKIVGENCTASCSLKTSVSVPKELPKKLNLFNYIKEKYGETVLNEMLTFNARSFSSWYDKEVEAEAHKGNFEFKLDMVEPYTYYSVGFRKRSKK